MRIETCTAVAQSLAIAGPRLYELGWALKLRRVESLGTLTEMAAELGATSVEAFQSNRWYAGLSLVRQLIETEYLMFLFAKDTSLVATWLDATPQKIRQEFSPSKMRDRAGSAFQAQEYWIHCDSGGHPSPAGRHLLSSHSDPIGSKEIHWLDLAQHLSRLWANFCQATLAADAHKLLPESLVRDTSAIVEKWRKGDLHREISVPED